MQNNYDLILDGVKEKVLILQDLSQPGWQLQVNKDGYLIYNKDNPENGLKINRTETLVQVDAEALVQLVFDLNRRKEYDDNFLESKLLETIDENTKIFYGRGKAPVFFVDPRDFVFLSRIYKTDFGYMVVTKSVEHPSAPPIKGVVRADMIFAAWILFKQPNGMTKIVMIGNMNPKGDIPKAIINTGYKFQAEGVKKALAHLAKQKK